MLAQKSDFTFLGLNIKGAIMSKIPKKVAILASLLFFITSCAAFKPFLDKERASKVKRVAIISFEVQQKQPKDAFMISKLGETSARRGDSKELREMSQKMYDFLRDRVMKKTGWKVASRNNFLNDEKYKNLYQKKMTGLKRVSMTSENTEIVHVTGILDNANYRSLSFAEKVSLAKSVGANAFAEYIAYQEIHQGYSLGNLTGEASFQMTNRSNLMVFGFDSEEPLWRVQNIDGEKSKSSKDLKGKKSVLEKLSIIGYESSKSSIDKTVNYYNKL